MSLVPWGACAWGSRRVHAQPHRHAAQRVVRPMRGRGTSHYPTTAMRSHLWPPSVAVWQCRRASGSLRGRRARSQERCMQSYRIPLAWVPSVGVNLRTGTFTGGCAGTAFFLGAFQSALSSSSPASGACRSSGPPAR
eukprot:1769450-Prymnesium_polylepis.1